jgi:hypothetical protein
MSSDASTRTTVSRTTPSSGIRALAVVAVIAQLLFLVTWLIAPLWQGTAYSVVAHSISDMYAVTAPGGLVLVIVFTFTGAVTVLFALLAVWRAFRPAGWTGIVGAILLALSIFGLGDLLTPFERLACRIADPGCTSASQTANAGGTLDNLLSTIGIGVFVVAVIFVSVAMSQITGWRSWVWPTRAVAVAVFALFFAYGVLATSGLGGLLERGLALVGALAIAILALEIARGRTPDPQG